MLPHLDVLAQVGLIFYMFLVGLELDPRLMRGRGQAAAVVSHVSIIFPFILGCAAALLLFPTLGSESGKFLPFALFLGASMSITAFPVLARILVERGIYKTHLGVVALTCAAVDDVTAWCLLALIVGIAQGSIESAVVVVALAVFFAGLMLFVVRPLFARILSSRSRLHAKGLDAKDVARDGIAMVLAGLVLSAAAAEWIGIHAIFGAFLFGAILPRGGPLSEALREKMHDLVAILLLPAYFAFTGMRTQIGLMTSADAWLLCGLIILVGTLGKFGGTFAGARLNGMDARTSARLGILMNTRGLMELIVLNVGRDLNVISPTLFTMMVLMALVTTIATMPILDALGKGDTHTFSQVRTHPRSER
jgi:Kef-type K+ transport system membrane component KefB